MKKIIWLIFLVLTLSSCWLTNEETFKEVKICEENWFIWDIQKTVDWIVIKVVCRRPKTEIELKEIKEKREYRLEKLKIKALKSFEVK